jgi:signal transduction histidine kinase/CheY-like chemotaxis protein
MWMSFKSYFQSKNLLIFGMILSTLPVALTFFLVNETERMGIIHRHSIAVQAKLDDLNVHIKDWLIYTERELHPQREEKMIATEKKVNQDIFELYQIVKINPEQVERTDRINQLWKLLAISNTKIQILFEIDKTIDLINETEEQIAQEKQQNISEVTSETKVISATSFFLGILMTLISIYITNKNLKIERKLNDELRISETKAREASRLKASFLATVSHEIRTPLNGIIGLSDVLRKMNLKDEEFRYAELIHKSGQTLLRIINDILDFSKIESGKILLTDSDFSVRDIVDQVISTLNPKAAEKSILLDFVIDRNIPKILFGDFTRISQILYNLTGNAIKFTSSGSVVIKVNFDSITEENKARIYFSVTDTGLGLSKDQQEKLFQPFTQLQKVGTSGEPGTGLGLSICRQILRAMNSDIFVESQVDIGSRFYFTLDFAKFSEEKIGLSLQAKKNPTLNRQEETKPLFEDNEKPTILVAEDNPTNQITAQVMLERLGAHVIIASNGAESVDLVASNDIDLIFMDCQMPVMDGFEATAKIRTKNTRLPIIAMTANASHEDQEACSAAGMNSFISKPITIDVLVAELKRNLKPDPHSLNEEILQKLEFAIGAPGKSRVIRAFLSRLPEIKSSLDFFEIEIDLDGIKKIAHRYKSSTETVGAQGLSFLFKRLEKVNQPEIAKKIIGQIQLALSDVELKLQQHC